jgi:hypothetical protein
MKGGKKEDDGDLKAIARRRNAVTGFIMQTIDNFCSAGSNSGRQNSL